MPATTRRNIIQGALTLGLSHLVADGTPLSTAQAEKRRKLKVVVTGGHPGDPEYGCGGTIARYTDQGHGVVLLYLNRGEGGIAGKTAAEAAAIRSAEAQKACEILKARPVFAGQIDGKSEINAAHYEKYRNILEEEKPDVVFTHWPIDGHADHRANFLLVYDAWLHLARRFGIYYYEVTTGNDTLQFAPTHYVDISAIEQRKRAACFAHASQAPDSFYGVQEKVTRFRGLESGHQQAEAFIRHVQCPDWGLP